MDRAHVEAGLIRRFRTLCPTWRTGTAHRARSGSEAGPGGARQLSRRCASTWVRARYGCRGAATFGGRNVWSSGRRTRGRRSGGLRPGNRPGHDVCRHERMPLRTGRRLGSLEALGCFGSEPGRPKTRGLRDGVGSLYVGMFALAGELVISGGRGQQTCARSPVRSRVAVLVGYAGCAIVCR